VRLHGGSIKAVNAPGGGLAVEMKAVALQPEQIPAQVSTQPRVKPFSFVIVDWGCPMEQVSTTSLNDCLNSSEIHQRKFGGSFRSFLL